MTAIANVSKGQTDMSNKVEHQVCPGETCRITIQVHYNHAHVKVEYHADAEYENPLKNSEKIACVGQRLLYPIMEKIIRHHASLKKKYHLVFNKKLFCNQKYKAKITNPITKPQFLTIIKLTYTGIK